MGFAKNIFGENFLIFGIFKRIFGIKYEFLAYFLPQKRNFKNHYVLANFFYPPKGKLFYPPNFLIPFPKTEKEKGFQEEKIKKKGTKKKQNFLQFFLVDSPIFLPKKEIQKERKPNLFLLPKKKREQKKREKKQKERKTSIKGKRKEDFSRSHFLFLSSLKFEMEEEKRGKNGRNYEQFQGHEKQKDLAYLSIDKV